MMVTRTWSSQESKTLRHPAEAAEKTSSVAKRSPPAQMISREAEEAMSLTAQPHIKNDFKSKTKTINPKIASFPAWDTCTTAALQSPTPHRMLAPSAADRCSP
jgi:hypothetical protein